MDDTIGTVVGVIIFVALTGIMLVPFLRAQMTYRRMAQEAGEPDENWIRQPARDPRVETARQELVARFWRWAIANTIATLALVAWFLYIFAD
jgi:hypothetical protein